MKTAPRTTGPLILASKVWDIVTGTTRTVRLTTYQDTFTVLHQGTTTEVGGVPVHEEHDSDHALGECDDMDD